VEDTKKKRVNANNPHSLQEMKENTCICEETINSLT